MCIFHYNLHSVVLRKKHSVLEVDGEMLCRISFPNIAKTYSVHYYFKVASDDP